MAFLRCAITLTAMRKSIADFRTCAATANHMAETKVVGSTFAQNTGVDFFASVALIDAVTPMNLGLRLNQNLTFLNGQSTK